MAGIYLHVPFCPYLCPYCDFAKEPWKRSREQKYLKSLTTEIAAAPQIRAQTLFIGGGTPNTVDPQALAERIVQVRERFALPTEAEITIECNPDPERRGGLQHYVNAGVNRLSIGAQSFVQAELTALGRGHTPSDTISLVKQARDAGIASLSLDIIFAAPGQTLASLDYSLDAILALDVDHVSCYGLTIEEDTPFAERFATDPGYFVAHELEAQLYSHLIARLEEAGYDHYELSNFARGGNRCQHNANYWNNGQYLGFGVGAASFYDGRRWTTTRSLDDYCAAVDGGLPAPCVSEKLEGAARLGEAAMLALRTCEGVDFDAFDTRYGVVFADYYHKQIAENTELGYLEFYQRSVRLTDAGKLFANDVCAAFLALPHDNAHA